MFAGEVDGVPVTWQDHAGDVQASLVFGAGVRDEGVDGLGLNHLVQLLVLESVSTEADQQTGVVDTAFTASGSPAEVAEHLTECCAALAELARDRIDDLAGVAAQADASDRVISLDLELSDPCRDPWASLLARRLGAAGAGVLRWPPVDYTDFTADEVRAHVAGYFTGGNAALALTRAPWPGLRLPLPSGERPVRADLVPVRPGSGWYEDEVAGPGLAVTAAAGPAAHLVFALLHRRVNQALEEAGLDCVATPWLTPVGTATALLGLGVQFSGKRGRDTALAARILWEQLRSLAEAPVPQADLDWAVSWHAGDGAELPEELRRILDRQGVTESLRAAMRLEPVAGAARAGLLGVCDSASPAELAAAAELTPAELRAAVASWLHTALVVVPVGSGVQLDGLARFDCPLSSYVPEGRMLRPSLLRKFGRGEERLVLAPDGIHHVRGDGSVHSFPTNDAMVVEQGKQVYLGNVRHGCLVDVGRLADAVTLAEVLPPRRLRRIG
ncbi:hypothetical protein QEZ54_17675 [Catellatospora sp. KI3]|uniref:hypothetical protein n=1 Tax=Catellatospora sp. KI3 TaxID=3041620 RepID=UPI002482BC7D|nr:hypothetical protein [Catellatospora sp. KI3]MDI1462809.1 hypothetical protein [Catellatospora sp. KI3]